MWSKKQNDKVKLLTNICSAVCNTQRSLGWEGGLDGHLYHVLSEDIPEIEAGPVSLHGCMRTVDLSWSSLLPRIDSKLAVCSCQACGSGDLSLGLETSGDSVFSLDLGLGLGLVSPSLGFWHHSWHHAAQVSDMTSITCVHFTTHGN